ncbi:Sec-independent protein translocase, TatC subunit [Paenibacillus algicola]|uniref:Sec-independent protein translocase protein TatC n=1 Tax=Paenibacillus algicola TaxID=2565926 RepID=A0A4P8XJJ3_9BACL|nr:twin-arginine translocase subunit TatC [Paenibacillus algicola]QCT02817.1 Sec-independent protein translocase, TatC subunit [Paenibacillus algicola]
MIKHLLQRSLNRRADPNAQNAIQHLEELRRRLITVFTAFLVSMAAALIGVKPMYAWLVRDLDQKLILLGPSDVIWVYMVIAAVAALVVTLPIAAYQIWRFVQPALPDHGRRAAQVFIPLISVQFVLGISFGYFVLFPMVYEFMKGMAAGSFETMYTAQKYFTFLVHMTVPFGVLFEMPVVIVFLTKLGILNPERLSKSRKMAYFLLCIIAVTITPPDIMSDLIVIVPLFLLYEISIGLSKAVYARSAQLDPGKG